MYKSDLEAVLVPYGTIEKEGVVLQHHCHENADSYASLTAHQKIALNLSSSFSPRQIISSSPVTA